MADFETAYEKTLRAEGGYRLTDVKGDKGGQTYAGIARNMHPRWPGWVHVDRGDVPPSSLVREFYRLNFWQAVQGDEIASQEAAESLYDFAVNAGARTAVKLAQVALGVTPDGALGPRTLAALNAIPGPAFVTKYAIAKVARYAEICNRDRTQSKFLLGWINRTLEALK